MKKTLFLLFALAFFSCTKSGPDPADKFVGTYLCVDDFYYKWMSDETSFMVRTHQQETRTITITKGDSDKVIMTGDWTTIGTVYEDTYVLFIDQTHAKGEEYELYSFGLGTLEGNTLKFNYTCSGNTYNNGVIDYVVKYGEVTAVKQ